MFEAIVRQCLPPVLLPVAKKVGKLFRKPNPRTEVLRAAYDALNRDTGADRITLRDGLTLKVHPDSHGPMQAFCWCAPDMVEEMDVFLALTAGRKRLLDIGALHGVFSLAFAVQDRDRKAVAVDPSPLAFAKLLYNIHKNDLADRVSPFECALSVSVGRIRMSFEWEHAVAASSTPQTAEPVTVDKMTADSLCERLGFTPDVVKIDVEGHEVKVMRGLAGILRDARPLLFVELHPQRIRQEGDDAGVLFGLLRDAGYRAKVSSRFVGFDELLPTDADQRVVFEWCGESVR